MILRRLPDSRFSEVLPNWSGETAVLIGGGPSLTLDQVETARVACQDGRCKAIAINNAYTLAPWANVLYAADPRWWGWHKSQPELLAFAGERCRIQAWGTDVSDQLIHVLRNRDYPNHGKGISRDSQALVTGWNSGFQALNLAILAGAKTLVLLGFDGNVGADGKTHFHAGHPVPTPSTVYEQYRRACSAAEDEIESLGVRVVNCSPGSWIDSFPKMALEAVL